MDDDDEREDEECIVCGSSYGGPICGVCVSDSDALRLYWWLSGASR